MMRLRTKRSKKKLDAGEVDEWRGPTRDDAPPPPLPPPPPPLTARLPLRERESATNLRASRASGLRKKQSLPSLSSPFHGIGAGPGPEIPLPPLAHAYAPKLLAERKSPSPLPACNAPPLHASTHHGHADTIDNIMASLAPDNVLSVGDTVEVPGGMTGTVRYVGNVAGKNGTFAGVELSREFAARGKNDGDVDGTKYFATTVPGAGIFLPTHRAIRQSSDAPPTPGTSTENGISTSHTPPTPAPSKLAHSLGPGARPPQFSQSVGPGVRPMSPQFKPKRPSLPRPESPIRRQPSLPSTSSMPNGRPSTGGLSSSMRGARPPTNATQTPTKSIQPSRSTPAASKLQTPQQTPSLSQSRSSSRLGDQSPDDEATPLARSRISRLGGPRLSSQNSIQSQAQGDNAAKAENTRLQRSLEDRDKQLKEQAASLAEMESSLAELQSLMAASNLHGTTTGSSEDNTAIVDADTKQLRTMLREKNEKIALLTAEFDAHRADFRSTIDTLEMASTETERVYEKRVEELLHEITAMQAQRSSGTRLGEVESFARQLKQLENLVAELEEGLEEARRSEAEAKSEVEFLRGEVERSRTELRRERDKAAKALQGAGAAIDKSTGGSTSRDIEQRDDEIRGLKAIIHSLSAGGNAGGSPAGSNRASRTSINNGAEREELARLRTAVETLTRERGELQGLIERKNFREEELERQLGKRNSVSSPGSGHKGHSASVASARTAIHSGIDAANDRDYSSNYPGPYKRASSNSVRIADPALIERPDTSHSSILNDRFVDANETTSPRFPHRPASGSASGGATGPGLHEESSTATTDILDDESEAYCEICDSHGHDMLNCTEVGGTGDNTHRRRNNSTQPKTGSGVASPVSAASPAVPQSPRHAAHPSAQVAPLTFATASRSSGSAAQQPSTATIPEAADVSSSSNNAAGASNPAVDLKTLPPDAPAPGKASGRIDPKLWCALCERDGHSSVDCPFETDF